MPPHCTSTPPTAGARCVLAGLVVLALAATGCQTLSKSSASLASSASAALSLHSSSDIMTSARLDYQEDVRALALAAAESGASGNDLRDRLGRVAAHHGITDWEADELTYQAVGEGLASSGMDAHSARVFAEEISDGNSAALGAVVAGYDS